jgi:hypothetical protein
MPERDLAAAILRQAWLDLRAADPRVRQEAETFWATPETVEFWDDALALDGALLRHAAAVVQAPAADAMLPRQLALF